ncbi:hypothetical protein VQ056_07720 [Paenibacillus sp. JTLBN-2024]
MEKSTGFCRLREGADARKALSYEEKDIHDRNKILLVAAAISAFFAFTTMDAARVFSWPNLGLLINLLSVAAFAYFHFRKQHIRHIAYLSVFGMAVNVAIQTFVLPTIATLFAVYYLIVLALITLRLAVTSIALLYSLLITIYLVTADTGIVMPARDRQSAILMMAIVSVMVILLLRLTNTLMKKTKEAREQSGASAGRTAGAEGALGGACNAGHRQHGRHHARRRRQYGVLRGNERRVPGNFERRHGAGRFDLCDQ